MSDVKGKTEKYTTRRTVNSAIENTFPDSDTKLLEILKSEFLNNGVKSRVALKNISSKKGSEILSKAFYKYADSIGDKILNNEEVDEDLLNYITIYAEEKRINFSSLISPKGAAQLAGIIRLYHGNKGIETISSKFDK